jgi:hypothetical protein
VSIIDLANVEAVVVGTVVIIDADFFGWQFISYALSVSDAFGAFGDVGIVEDGDFVGVFVGILGRMTF